MSTLVYHGAACAVPHPLAGYGRADLDFGQGFYVTTLRGQAERWANIVAMRIPQGKAILNIYELDTEQICLLNQRLIDQCLHFKESVTLPQAGNPAQKGGIPC